MNQTALVYRKEILDILRDRRTLTRKSCNASTSDASWSRRQA